MNDYCYYREITYKGRTAFAFSADAGKPTSFPVLGVAFAQLNDKLR